MRKLLCLVPLLAACSGGDADPVKVARRFHASRVATDDRGVHALLSDADRAAVPLEAFPAALPPGLELEIFGWGATPVDSATLVGPVGDTAAVLLHLGRAGTDTVQLVATRTPRRLWRFNLDRVRWRVFLGIPERALMDSLAVAVRATEGTVTPAAVAAAKGYVEAAERHPAIARASDLYAARATLRRAAIAEALRIDVRAEQTFTGTRVLGGKVTNPTSARVATLRLILTDVAGAEERVELWDIAPGGTVPIGQLTRLRMGPVEHRIERIQLF